MKKIFKYTYNPETRTASLPEDAVILRVDYVDDGFYKGHFVWAIVTVGEPNVERSVEPISCWKPDGSYMTVSTELRVKEKQTITTYGLPVKAGEQDGKLYVHCLHDGPKQEHQIAFYKTGQIIDLPVEKLEYVGFSRLWIVQELCLYVFHVKL